MLNTEGTIIPEVQKYFFSTIRPQLVSRCEDEALTDMRKGTAPILAFRKSGCYYNSYDKNYKRIVRAKQRRFVQRKLQIEKKKTKKKSSIQVMRHELNRTVTELRQGQKRINYLEETVTRLEKRYFGLGLLCVCSVIVAP